MYNLFVVMRLISLITRSMLYLLTYPVCTDVFGILLAVRSLLDTESKTCYNHSKVISAISDENFFNLYKHSSSCLAELKGVTFRVTGVVRQFADPKIEYDIPSQ